MSQTTVVPFMPDQKNIHKSTRHLTIGQLVYLDCSIVEPMPNQPREDFDAVELKALEESIATIGQQDPAKVIIIGPDKLRLRDGERRWRCCKALDIPLRAVVMERRSDDEEYELAIVANMHRSEHTAIEKARAMKRLQEYGRTYEQIAKAFGCTTATVNNYLQIFRDLDPRVVNLMDPRHTGRRRVLQHTVALELTPFKQHSDLQFTLALRIVQEEMTLSQARALIAREARKKNITSGRGLSAQPHDHRETLQRVLDQLEPRIDRFLDMSDKEIVSTFQMAPESVHARMLRTVRQRLVDLKTVYDRVNKVKNPGCKRPV